MNHRAWRSDYKPGSSATPSPQQSLPFPDSTEPGLVPVPAEPPARPAPRTWYFIGTTLFGVGAFAIETIAQLVMYAVPIFGFGVAQVQTDAELKAVMMNGAWLSLAVIAGLPVVVGALWVPVRLARQGYRDYLGLRWPSRRELASGLIVLVAFQLAWLLLRLAVGLPIPDFMIDTYKTAKASGRLTSMSSGSVSRLRSRRSSFFEGSFYAAGRSRSSGRRVGWC